MISQIAHSKLTVWVTNSQKAHSKLTVWVILWVHREVTECPHNELSVSFNVSSQWASYELKFFTGMNSKIWKWKLLAVELTRCNSFHLSDALREAQSNNKDLARQVNELTSIRVQLEGERDSLAAELADARDALRDAQARLDAANNALSALRSEMEQRLREKDDEIDSIRWVKMLRCFWML